MHISERVPRLGIHLATLLLVAATWDRGGLRELTLPYYNLAALLLLAILLATAILTWRKSPHPRFRIDPLVVTGGLFILYLTLQWWNAGRTLYFDAPAYEWRYTPPPRPGLPFAYARVDAAQILMWFFPAWVIALFLRQQARANPRLLLQMLHILVIQAGILALLGIYQFATKSSIFTWIWHDTRPGLSPFAYANFTAAYFAMLAAIATGLLYREIFRSQRAANPLQAWLWGTCAILCIVSANLSLSRAGIILSWSLAAFAALYGLKKGWKRFRPVKKLNAALATLATLVILYFMVSGFGASAIRREFDRQPGAEPTNWQKLARINLDLTVRPELWRAGWDVFLANRWLGNGAWGFKYELAFHIPEEEWNRLVRPEGYANVHNDPIQFLSEFGIIGSTFLLASLGIIMAPLFGQKVIRGSLFSMTIIGLSLVFIFSIIDLPYRSPAILWTWTAFLAALAGMTRGHVVKTSPQLTPTGRENNHAAAYQ
jgi:hypothetical protein